MEQSPGLGHNGPPAEVPADEVAPSIFNDYRDRYIDERPAAEFVGFSVAFLQNLRYRGGGPPYSKINKSVRYITTLPDGSRLLGAGAPLGPVLRSIIKLYTGGP